MKKSTIKDLSRDILDSDIEGFITHLRAAFGKDFVWMNTAGHSQTILRLFIFDGVPTGKYT